MCASIAPESTQTSSEEVFRKTYLAPPKWSGKTLTSRRLVVSKKERQRSYAGDIEKIDTYLYESVRQTHIWETFANTQRIKETAHAYFLVSCTVAKI